MSTAKKKLTTCEPKTAVAYARYSSAQQRDVSIEQQLRDIRAYAEREGYKIIYEYADHAKSGFKNVERRTQFQAMKQNVEATQPRNKRFHRTSERMSKLSEGTSGRKRK